MSKALKIIIWIVGILLILVLLFNFVAKPILIKSTKKHSPEVTEVYAFDDLKIEIIYSSPSKKGRVIFGELVPYDEVWRTGANEATTFTTNKDLEIDGKTLAAGKYTLWTIPTEKDWQIIFNSEMYPWGVKWQDSKAMREPEHDALVTTALVSESLTTQENFSIKVVETPAKGMVLMFSWDRIVIPLPMKTK
jgi:hypothetical protein